MKKNFLTLLAFALTVMPVAAQTFNVKVGGVSYLFPAGNVGNMTYENGSKLTVMDRVFVLDEIRNMAVNPASADESTVQVSYSQEPDK